MTNKLITPATQTKPMVYQIRLKGQLNCQWATWFSNFTLSHEDSGNTMLIGEVRDQAELFALLKKVRDLSLTLLLVESI